MRELFTNELKKYIKGKQSGEQKGYVWGAIVGGLMSSFTCGIIYVAVAFIFGYHTWYAAFIGAAIGFSVRWAGRGAHSVFGIIAAVCACTTCVLCDRLMQDEIGICLSARCLLSRLFFYLVAGIEAFVIGTKEEKGGKTE